jgi:hypothetical protein
MKQGPFAVTFVASANDSARLTFQTTTTDRGASWNGAACGNDPIGDPRQFKAAAAVENMPTSIRGEESLYTTK